MRLSLQLGRSPRGAGPGAARPLMLRRGPRRGAAARPRARRPRAIFFAALAWALTAAVTPSYGAQRGGFHGRAFHAFHPPARAERRNAAAEDRGGGNKPLAAGKPLGAGLERLTQLPPAEQRRVLRQDPAFRNLPPERRRQILNRLRWFNSLPPNRQQEVLRRMRALGQLTPEQRNGLERIYQNWRSLPPGRQQALRRAYASLSRLTPERRAARLNNPNFQMRFSPQEIGLLHDALALNLPSEVVTAPRP